ncbi:MAG: hypothetical protein R3F20_19600 [Planctomycetota bacterium]
MFRASAPLLAFAALLALPLALVAQDADQRSRVERARQELEAIRLAAESLGPLDRRPREELPDPWPAAVDLVDRIHDFAREYADLAVATTARRLLPDVHSRNGDVAARIAALLAIAADEPREDRRAALEMEAAALAAEWGDPARAREAWDRLGKVLPAKDRATYEPRLADWERARRDADRDGLRATSSLPPAGTPLDARSRGLADRFIASRPLHPAARTLLETILPRLDRDASPLERRFYAERLAFFHPESELVADLRPALVAGLVALGDYEKAWLHARDARRRGAGTVSADVEKAVAARLTQVAARKLGLDRNTRHRREIDLRRRIGRGAPGDELLEIYRGYAGDYPGAIARVPLGWEVARAAYADMPDDAYTLTRALLAAPEADAFRFEALQLAQRHLARLEGDAAVLELLGKEAPRLTDPRQRAAVELDRVDLLVKDGRPDEALALLRPPVAAATDPVAKGALEKKLAELKAEYGD